MLRAWSRVSAVLVALVALVGGLLVTASAASASPSAVPDNTVKVDATDGVNGVVYAVTHIGGITYIGGAFSSVDGQPRQNLAAINPDGTLNTDWNPAANGVVYALAASSDSSKVFVGGGFTTVGGIDRGRLAAVTADTGAVVENWTTTTSNNLVRALVTDSGDRLYVGGSFTRIGGKAVPRLAAVSQSTGVVATATTEPAFAPPMPSATIRALTLSDDGSMLYAGGGFSTIGGVARAGAAELDTSTGAVTSFAPSDGGVVISMDITPNGRLFFGTTSNRTWAYDPAVSNTGLYRIRSGGDTQAILATNDEVYIGGHFNTLPEQKLDRLALASFSPVDGAITDWNPRANGPFGVWAIDMSATKLHIGGDFTRVGGLARRGYTSFTL
jgi:hypothetical protein